VLVEVSGRVSCLSFLQPPIQSPKLLPIVGVFQGKRTKT
jgi:hypothetical protein